MWGGAAVSHSGERIGSRLLCKLKAILVKFPDDGEMLC